jgi:hypothetical protein
MKILIVLNSIQRPKLSNFFVKPRIELKGPEREKPIFLKNVLHSFIWFSFVGLDKLILNIYRAGLGLKLSGWEATDDQSTSVRDKKARRSNKYFQNILAHSGSIFFLFF